MCFFPNDGTKPNHCVDIHKYIGWISAYNCLNLLGKTCYQVWMSAFVFLGFFFFFFFVLFCFFCFVFMWIAWMNQSLKDSFRYTFCSCYGRLSLDSHQWHDIEYWFWLDPKPGYSIINIYLSVTSFSEEIAVYILVCLRSPVATPPPRPRRAPLSSPSWASQFVCIKSKHQWWTARLWIVLSCHWKGQTPEAWIRWKTTQVCSFEIIKLGLINKLGLNNDWFLWS